MFDSARIAATDSEPGPVRGDVMTVTKPGTHCGRQVTVVDPKWNGMAKVETMDGQVKSYLASQLTHNTPAPLMAPKAATGSPVVAPSKAWRSPPPQMTLAPLPSPNRHLPGQNTVQPADRYRTTDASLDSSMAEGMR